LNSTLLKLAQKEATQTARGDEFHLPESHEEPVQFQEILAFSHLPPVVRIIAAD
jgi:hypothetical protein